MAALHLQEDEAQVLEADAEVDFGICVRTAPFIIGEAGQVAGGQRLKGLLLGSPVSLAQALLRELPQKCPHDDSPWHFDW